MRKQRHGEIELQPSQETILSIYFPFLHNIKANVVCQSFVDYIYHWSFVEYIYHWSYILCSWLVRIPFIEHGKYKYYKRNYEIFSSKKIQFFR